MYRDISCGSGSRRRGLGRVGSRAGWLRCAGCGFALLGWILASFLRAGVADAADREPASLSDAEIERRLDFLESRLDASKRHAQIWYWSWLALNGGATVGLSVGSAITDEADTRASLIPQAVLAALGVADLTVFRPIQARHGADPIRALPSATREERLAKLEEAEALLHHNAERAAGRKKWTLHLANVGVNAAAGLATLLAGTRSDALISFASGAVGGEIYIWSEPGRPERDWEDYERFRTDTPVAVHPRAALVAGPGRVGFKFEW